MAASHQQRRFAGLQKLDRRGRRVFGIHVAHRYQPPAQIDGLGLAILGDQDPQGEPQ
jgi:hypothetical protein